MPLNLRARLARAGLPLALVFGVPAFLTNTAGQTIVITPTTTLAAETANNTSASNSFVALGNGDTAPGNVSKSPSRSLMYAGNTTAVYAHYMGWFGSSSHMNVGYASNDPAVVHKQVMDMKSRGISGAILDWYGPGDLTDQNAALLKAESEAHGFTFAITEDVGSTASFAKTNNCDTTQKIIDDLNYLYTNYQQSPAYMRVNSRPVVFFFGVDAYYIDWSRVRAEVSGNPLFLFRNPEAFTKPNSDGGFGWVEINSADPYDMNTAYLDNFYATAVANPSQIVYGTGYVGFNETLASWTSNRVMHRQCGYTWLKSFAEATKYYSTTNQLPFTQIATWNDYEEGTEIETGIENCLNVVSWTSGGTLYWKLEGNGPTDSVFYFRIFISEDGQNLMRLTDVTPSTRSASLSQWTLSTSKTYTFFVKAMGKPSVFNKMSNPVAYRKGDAPPVARLTLSKSSGTVPLTITASTSSSTDSDGRVVSSRIDFGDGTVVNGPTATHTYSDFSAYTVRAFVFDDRGAMGTASAAVTARQPNTGVTIWQPSAGAVLANYFRVVASALGSGAAAITSMTVYVNGKSRYRINADRLDIRLRFPDGNYLIGINAWDATGKVYITTANVHVGIGSNAPPIPAVTLDDFSPAVGQRIRACTAQSRDPDGGGTSTVVDFGDGSTRAGTTTYHAYASPGTYQVKATVTDSRGLSASTTVPVTVH